MVQSVVAGLVVLAIAATAARWRGPARKTSTRTRSTLRVSITARRRRAARLDREIGSATRNGEWLVTAVRGSNPSRVKRSGACPSEQLVYTDLDAYRRDMLALRVPLTSTTWQPRLPRAGERGRSTNKALSSAWFAVEFRVEVCVQGRF
jgi:hypothetical protein